eukprot:NODE_190_length_15503_cov_0.365814.p6 type:complete len:187 gc:universal NODE_190_length_15503_cov_0.365814:413-973(+)
MLSEKLKMINGEMYYAMDPDLTKDRINARMLTRQYNNSLESELDKRQELLVKLFSAVGANCFIEPTIKCDYGYNVKIGNNFFANFDLILLDVCPITIGNNCFFGPGVHIYTATHPLNAAKRISGVEYGKPVIIGNNVWICGGAIINPGVKIGNDVVIGSGSVVTKDVRDSVMIAGNPAVFIKEIND